MQGSMNGASFDWSAASYDAVKQAGNVTSGNLVYAPVSPCRQNVMIDNALCHFKLDALWRGAQSSFNHCSATVANSSPVNSCSRVRAFPSATRLQAL